MNPKTQPASDRRRKLHETIDRASRVRPVDAHDETNFKAEVERYDREWFAEFSKGYVYKKP
jgi:hypothetical protein